MEIFLELKFGCGLIDNLGNINMINNLDLNREHLVPQSKDKKIKDIDTSDLKLSIKEIANADVINFTCHLENETKFLKHRWSINLV